MLDNSMNLAPEITPPIDADLNPPSLLAERGTGGEANSAFRLTIAVDQVLYAIFFGVALVLRLAELGTIVLSDAEAREALSVFRVLNPNAAGSPLLTTHPLLFAANALTMTVGGSANMVVRLPTVIVSLLLILMPLLFRRWIGRTSAVILAGLFTLSPVLLTASRSMSASVWSLALALFSVWLIGRFMETRRAAYALSATTTLALLVFASEASGFLVALSLIVGLAFALATTDDPDRGTMRAVRDTLTGWPWLRGLLIAGGALILVGTVFFLHLSGLGGIGEVVGRSLQGFVIRPAQNPVAFPLLTSLIYEPVFWIFGVVGAAIVLREDGSFLQRGLVGWLIAGIVACLVYPGASAQHALWLTIPLAGLAAITIERILTPVQDRFWNVPVWGPWLHGIGVVATLSITAINVLTIGNAALRVSPALIPAIDQPFRLVLTLLTLALVVILFFLIGSIWGSRAAWHGLGIGLLIFLGVYSLGSGWRASVTSADDAREFWRPHPAQQNLVLLEKELVTASLRNTGMPYEMPLSVAWADDGALAWAIHRFEKTTFVTQTSPALNGPAIIAPRQDEKPALGAAYVGMDFPVYANWDRGTMQYWDVFPWLYQRDSRVQPTTNERIVLWLRADVYGVPSSSLQNLGQPAPTK